MPLSDDFLYPALGLCANDCRTSPRARVHLIYAGGSFNHIFDGHGYDKMGHDQLSSGIKTSSRRGHKDKAVIAHQVYLPLVRMLVGNLTIYRNFPLRERHETGVAVIRFACHSVGKACLVNTLFGPSFVRVLCLYSFHRNSEYLVRTLSRILLWRYVP
ncbi:hypothetical protein B0H11DRAFT_1949329 [Mycena galericulata]|nr:hypothetical protein B0H11DRAFT_1949329 [Mycena galericulata]